MLRQLQSVRNILSSSPTKLPPRLKRFAEKQMLVILIFILFGDTFKFLPIRTVDPFSWIAGHFADIGLTAQLSTMLYYLVEHKKRGFLVAALLPPVLFSLYEFMQYPDSDPVDIACYFFGSFIALISISAYKCMINRQILRQRITHFKGQNFK
jgi:hypothetical protein